jgi:hypothetical protein
VIDIASELEREAVARATQVLLQLIAAIPDNIHRPPIGFVSALSY